MGITLKTSSSLPPQQVISAVLDVFGEVEWLVYATASEKPDDRRWRVLVPLARDIYGGLYRLHQQEFFARLALPTDAALERAAQLIYLPNKGIYYQWYHNTGPRLELSRDFANAVADRWQANKAAGRQKSERRESSILAIDVFNSQYRICDLLEDYGYETQDGSNWRSPMQESVSFATLDFEGHWVSLSDSDRRAGLGRDTADGNRSQER